MNVDGEVTSPIAERTRGRLDQLKPQFTPRALKEWDIKVPSPPQLEKGIGASGGPVEQLKSAFGHPNNTPSNYPLLMGSQGHKYQPWSHSDMTAVLAKLPPITSGGGRWLTKLMALCHGTTLAVGDLRCLLGQIFTASQMLGVKVLEKLQIVHNKGDIFSSPPQEPLAHCVSTDCAYGAGIAVTFCAYGAGIAVTFKDKYGVEKVKKQNEKPGECTVTQEEDGRTIFHLITKRKYTDLPTYGDFTNSVKHMRDWCVEHRVKSVSVPRLGCGLDKLDFQRVQDILREVFTGIDIVITIYSL